MGGRFLRQQRRAEEASKNKIIAQLKRENHHLQREVARLTKELSKIIEQCSGVEAEAEPQPLETAPPVGCPQCGGNLTHVSLPFGILVACQCGYRKVNKNA